MTVTTDIGTPPDLQLLLDFLNTLDVEAGTDELVDDPAARRIRDALRAVVSRESVRLPDVSLAVTVTERGIELEGHDRATNAVAVAASMTGQGTFSRVKLCPAHDCAWAFYDRSRNGSRTWCDMAVCGNREKARVYRAAH